MWYLDTSCRIVRVKRKSNGSDLLDKPEIVPRHKIETLGHELIAARSPELGAESGHPVMALSGASGAGVSAVLDKLLEALGHPEPGADEGDEASGWSPV